MKTRMVLLILLFFTPKVFSTDFNETDLQKYEDIINQVLVDLGSSIEKNAKSNNLKEVYSLCIENIGNGKIALEIDPKLETILSGSWFSMKENNTVSLEFGIDLLNIYNKKRSIVHSILIHEMRHAYDYFVNHELFILGNTDEKQKYWFELDALHVEAQYIEECVDPLERTKFEKYIYDSWIKDNLDSASVIIKRERMDTFFYFNNRVSEYYKDKSKKAEILVLIADYGDKILKAWNELDKNKEYECTFLVTTINTYYKYFFRTLKIMNNDASATLGKFYEENPRLENIIKTMDIILKENGQKAVDFYIKVIKYWEQDIRENKSSPNNRFDLSIRPVTLCA